MDESFYDRDYFEGKRVKPSFWARSKLGRTIENHLEAFFRAALLKILFKPKKVLDAGCGMGELVFWLRFLGVEAFGVDISDYAISNAHPPVRLYLKRGSITNLPYGDNSFDLVATFDVLEHIEEKDLDRALLECQRVSRSLVLHKIFLGSILFEVSDPSHVSVHPGEWWEEKFRKLGLKLSLRGFLKWEPGLFLLEAYGKNLRRRNPSGLVLQPEGLGNAEVSIIIRTKNEEKWVGKVLEKLFAQTFSDFEIIVVDSGSTDRTLEIIEEFPVQLIEIKPEEYNPAYALNLGISKAKGKYLCILSAHSLPMSNTWLEDGLSNFKDPSVAGVSGHYFSLPDGAISEKLGDLWGFLKGRHIRREENTPWMTNTNSLIRKDLWEKYPFDESLEGAEDYDWAKEMIARGYRIVKDPKFNVRHSHGGIGRPTYLERRARWKRLNAEINKRPRPRDSYSRIV